MEPVLYFKVLSIAWGALVLVKGPLVALFRRQRARVETETACPEKRPFWVWLTALAAIVLVAVTWLMYAKYRVPWSLVATLAVTLSVFRASQVLFNYPRFRRLELRLAEFRGWVVLSNAVVAALGVALILLGILVYR